MKLRNKKTGEIIDLGSITIFECSSKTLGISESIDDFHTIAELNEEWEDYKPAEPLIKDEKIRKCAKLWLEINEIYSVTYHERRGGGSYLELDNMPMRNGCCIVFQDLIEELKDGETYTIDELCGEEEE